MKIKERNPIFDIMKGLAIIFVIMFHCELSSTSYHVLAMFHVPLFFIISGYFAREGGVADFIRFRAKKILVPCTFCFLLMFFIVFLFIFFTGSDVLPVVLRSCFLGKGYVGEYIDGIMEVTIGPFWFLVSLFWVRLFWPMLNVIRREWMRGAVVLFLSMGAFFMNKYTANYWCIMSSLGAFSFYYVGNLIQKYGLLHNKKGRRIFSVCMIFFVYCLFFSKIDINMRVYEAYYIVDLLGCIGAFAVLYSVVSSLHNLSMKGWRLLNFMGRYSLVAFCIHAIDQCLNVHWLPLKVYAVFGFGVVDRLTIFGIRFMIVLIGTYLVSRTHFLKKNVFYIR